MAGNQTNERRTELTHEDNNRWLVGGRRVGGETNKIMKIIVLYLFLNEEYTLNNNSYRA